MLYIKLSNTHMQGRENHLYQRTNRIHGTHTKEALLNLPYTYSWKQPQNGNALLLLVVYQQTWKTTSIAGA